MITSKMLDLEQINITIEEAREHIAHLEALDRLYRNKDFQEIIDLGFFNKESIRLVLALSDPSLQSPDKQADIMKRIQTIGLFRQYLSSIYQIGNQAKMTLESYEETRNELMAEAL